MDKDTLVYCTECIRGEKLIEAIINDREIDEECNDCYPYDPEDSKRYEYRKKYEKK